MFAQTLPLQTHQQTQTPSPFSVGGLAASSSTSATRQATGYPQASGVAVATEEGEGSKGNNAAVWNHSKSNASPLSSLSTVATTSHHLVLPHPTQKPQGRWGLPPKLFRVCFALALASSLWMAVPPLSQQFFNEANLAERFGSGLAHPKRTSIQRLAQTVPRVRTIPFGLEGDNDTFPLTKANGYFWKGCSRAAWRQTPSITAPIFPNCSRPRTQSSPSSSHQFHEVGERERERGRDLPRPPCKLSG